MKKLFRLLVIVPLFAVFVAAPVFAGDSYYPSSYSRSRDSESYRPAPSGELILADALIVRPVAFVGSLVGMVGAALVTPLAVTSNSTEVVGEQLVEKPLDFTFCRPLGDFGDQD